jgi:hypothetical protein
MNHVFLASILALASFSASLFGTYFFFARAADAEAIVAEALEFDPYDDEAPVAYAAAITTSPDAPRILTLRDSLDDARAELRVMQAERSELEERLRATEAGGGQHQQRLALAQEVGDTLNRLEDRELAGIVQRLDLDVLRLIYEAASPRVRPRLLQAMSADRAAHFVGRLATGSTAPPRPTAAAYPLEEEVALP